MKRSSLKYLIIFLVSFVVISRSVQSTLAQYSSPSPSPITSSSPSPSQTMPSSYPSITLTPTPPQPLQTIYNICQGVVYYGWCQYIGQILVPTINPVITQPVITPPPIITQLPQISPMMCVGETMGSIPTPDPGVTTMAGLPLMSAHDLQFVLRYFAYKGLTLPDSWRTDAWVIKAVAEKWMPEWVKKVASKIVTDRITATAALDAVQADMRAAGDSCATSLQAFRTASGL